MHGQMQDSVKVQQSLKHPKSEGAHRWSIIGTTGGNVVISIGCSIGLVSFMRVNVARHPVNCRINARMKTSRLKEQFIVKSSLFQLGFQLSDARIFACKLQLELGNFTLQRLNRNDSGRRSDA
jgi:hypothetical protein